MKKLIVFLLILLLVSLLTLPTFAFFVAVRDELTLPQFPSDTGEYTWQIADGTDAGGVSYYLWCKESVSQSSIPSAATVATTLGFAENADAVVLLVRLVGSTYYYDMYTYGAAEKIFTDSAVDRILDDPDVYDKLKSGDISGGSLDFFNLCTEQILYVEERTAARNAARPWRILCISLIIGVLTGGFTALGIVLHYRRKKRGASYPLDRYAKLHLTLREDRFVGSYVTRTRIQSSSSSGGRSGGGGSHRGGR